MNRDDEDHKAPDAAAAADGPHGAGAPPGGPADAQPAHRGSDPPKHSGHPAARHAGDGAGGDADAAGPAAPTEIDRSTDA